MPVLSMDMEMRRSDSSGTDDDLPPTHTGHARATSGSGNGKAGNSNTAAASHGGGSNKNIDHLIRILEQDAYTSVLRAFGAQSEHITWAKERLISDLRKELRVTDEQHREFLAKVARDDSLRQIRDWRECGGDSTAPASNNVATSAAPPLVPQVRKKQKTGAASQVPMPPPAAPPPPPPPPPPAPPSKPAVASKKGAAAVAGVPRGKSKGNSDRNGRGPLKREPSPLPGKRKDGFSEAQDRWVGQTIKMRWPADNNFYEAYVKDFHKEDGTHTVVYDMGTENETSERVDLSTMAPEDIQCNGGLERKQSAKKSNQAFRKRDKPLTYSKADRKSSQQSKLPSVDSLAKQVEELEQDADLSKIEHAKKMAKEHEESIRKALLEVGESSDEEDSDGAGARQRDGYSRSIIVNSDEDKEIRRQQHQRNAS